MSVSLVKESPELLATVENMRRCEAAGKRNVVAVSFVTGEESSATPGDYFWLNPGAVLTDSEGEPMVLVERMAPWFQSVRL